MAPPQVKRPPSATARAKGGRRGSSPLTTGKIGRELGAAESVDSVAVIRGPGKVLNGRKAFAGEQLERLWVPNRAAWRAWLEEHHARPEGVWLISFKKVTGKPRVAYEDAVEEALCFGWIDSLVRTLDAHRAMQLFSPRKARSPWSKPNKLRVGRLIAAGLMRPAGLAKIEQAKRDGSWDVYAVAESLEEPPDLRAAFAAGRPAAKPNWDAFSPSSRRAILWWVHSAKRPETRAQRIAAVVREAAQNRRANFPVDRDRR